MEADQMSVEQWLAIRKEAGLKIDPETAEVMWTYAQTLDPYGVYPDLPVECDCVGREYLPVFPEATFGSAFATCPKRFATTCGKSTVRGTMRQRVGFLGRRG